MKFKLKIDDKVIEVAHKYDYIRRLSKDFIVCDSEKADFSVSVSERELEEEKNDLEEEFSEAVCESTCIHRKIAEEMSRAGSILIHSAVITLDGEAYAFLAKSGVGKSTHLRQWMKHFGSKAVVLNGDKPMYSYKNDRLLVHGSPFKGKEGWGINASAPVKAFCFIERGEKNEIRRASTAEIISRLFHQLLMPKEPKELNDYMALIDRISREIPFYILKCNISEEAAEVAYCGMK